MQHVSRALSSLFLSKCVRYYSANLRVKPSSTFSSSAIQYTKLRLADSLSANSQTVDNPVDVAYVKKVTRKLIGELPQIRDDRTDRLPSWNGGLDIPEVLLKNSVSGEEENTPNPVKSPSERNTRARRVSRKKIELQEPQTVAIGETETLVKTMKREPRKQLAEEIKSNLARFPDCLLLTRVGQFYESIFDQAQEVAALLSIKLAKRNLKDGAVWLCGFPLSHLEKHLRTLVEKNHRSVALCEEFVKTRGSATTKPSFERRVVRILTPGTLIDESFLNPYVNNFLLAISTSKHDVLGLAWIDVSTGDFSSLETTTSNFQDHLARINPREVVLESSMDASSPVGRILAEENILISYVGTEAKFDVSRKDETQIPIQSSVTLSGREHEAIALLTNYLCNRLLEHTPNLLRHSRDDLNGRMQIDAHTLKALDVKENSADGSTHGSLMSVIKRTVTSSGTRLLSRWLCSPSTSITDLTARQNLVEVFFENPWLREDIVQNLRRVGDAAKILQRFSLGRGDIDDLIQIKQTIITWNTIKQSILSERAKCLSESGNVERNWASLDVPLAKMEDLTEVANRIEEAVETIRLGEGTPSLDEEMTETELSDDLTSPTASSSTPDARRKLTTLLAGDSLIWRMKPQFSEELLERHSRLAELQSEKKHLEAHFKDHYDAPSLSLRYSPSLGLYVHIARPRRDGERLGKSHVFHKISENASSRAYFNEEWSRIGGAIIETVDAIYNAEREAFVMLRLEVTSKAAAIRRTGRIIDELDVTSAFACLAAEMNFVKPSFTTSIVLEIKDGRHPTVETGLLTMGRNFTSNSLSMDDSSRLHIVTGPNMAGKSTYLRQTALIVILAQAGSFVPARFAKIGIVDKVFSRIGARDDLFRDRSTFMVEMLETANILKNATSRSLVIMDEVGRGTTMTDGISIAFAVICHLYMMNRCRTIFATHFHEIVDMLGTNLEGSQSDRLQAIRYYCTDVDETDDIFSYSHKLRPGINRQSHGLKVAQLGGLPPFAMQIAADTQKSISQIRSSDMTKATVSQLDAVGEETVQRLSSSNNLT